MLKFKNTICLFKKAKYRINLKIIYITKLKKPNVLIIHDYNLLPFFIFDIYAYKINLCAPYTRQKQKIL